MGGVPRRRTRRLRSDLPAAGVRPFRRDASLSRVSTRPSPAPDRGAGGVLATQSEGKVIHGEVGERPVSDPQPSEPSLEPIGILEPRGRTLEAELGPRGGAVGTVIVQRSAKAAFTISS